MRRIVLRPAQAFDILVELRRAFVEPRQITVRQMAVVLDGHLARHPDRGFADRLADVARTRVQHDPHGVDSSRQSSTKWLPPPSVPT